MTKWTGHTISTDSGMALIAVVWAVFLLALLATGIMSMTLVARKSVSALEQELQERYLAESALTLFTKQLLFEPDGKNDHLGLVSVFGVDATIDVRYSVGRININRADTSLLSAMFAAAGVTADTAITLAERMKDWRDKNTETEAGQDETLPYQELGLSYLPRNQAFEAVGELKLLAGLSPDTFNCVQPLLTVASPSGDVKSQFADEKVRYVLDWARQNHWLGLDWPELDPQDDFDVRAGIDLIDEELAIRVTLPGQPQKRYLARLRVKSAKLKTYATLSPIMKELEFRRPESCPW